MMEQRPSSSCMHRLCKSSICYVPLLTLGVLLTTTVFYVGYGLEQCFAPINGVETMPCGNVSKDLIQRDKLVKTLRSPVPMHQLLIDLNESSLKLNSKTDWLQTFPKTYQLYDTAFARSVIDKYYPHLIGLYDSYPEDVQRADLARIALLHHFGGIYSDLDAFPRERAVRLNRTSAGAIQTAYIPVGNGGVLLNHFLIANKGNKFLNYLLNSLPTFNSRWKWIPFPYLRTFLTTGPCAVTAALRNWQSRWEKNGKAIAPYVIRLEYPDCLVKHEGGREWLSIDGIIFNWVGDNFVLFVYLIVSIITFSVLVWLLCRLRARALTGGSSASQFADGQAKLFPTRFV